MTSIFLCHDHQDEAVAQAIAHLSSRVSLGQLRVWFSSDSSAGGGIRPGSIWLDELRNQLARCKSMLVLLTPTSVCRPWILFESGFAEASSGCEVIPLCVGIDPGRELPFPLAMYQCFQLTDYDSLKRFTSKLLRMHEVNFDEEMARPVLERSIHEITESLSVDATEAARPAIPTLDDFGADIKRHIDRRFRELVASDHLQGAVSGDAPESRLTEYAVPIFIPLSEAKASQFLRIEPDTTVQDVLDNVFYMLGSVKAFTYLEAWILRERNSGRRLIVREVASMIPARYVFLPSSSWEVIMLDQEYRASDSSDAVRRSR